MVKSPLGITISITQSENWLVTIQIVGRQVTCVAYDIELSVDAIRQAQCVQKPNHLKSKHGCHFAKNHLKSGEKCPDFECLD